MGLLAKYTWMAQLALHGLIIILTISILGVSVHLLQNHNTQSGANPWYLPLWPAHFDMRAIKATIGATAVMTFFELVVLVLAFLPRVMPTVLDDPTARRLTIE